ncbi:MAG: DUF5060 domain-containing protein [Planctomycetota bacterium]
MTARSRMSLKFIALFSLSAAIWHSASAQETLSKGSPTTPVSSAPLIQPRSVAGDGTVSITGVAKTWHPQTLTVQGPFADERDNQPNPFLDYRFSVTFEHEDGSRYLIPGYFAADGNAANSSASAGTSWRVHFTPDRVGKWTYKTSFRWGKDVAINQADQGETIDEFDGLTGSFDVQPSDASESSFRHHGRLAYVGGRYLKHAGTGKRFVKAGADAPETLLGYADFDGTVGMKEKKVPLKTWQAHLKDWREGDPTWKDGRGKGLIGAINYLSGKGCNAFSFLTYNAGGDGDNVWPFIDRNDKLHYDCSKLDQWGIVFDHGTDKSMYLHFKMQETENDDHTTGHKAGKGFKKESLDGGDLGRQRKLYCRELVARFSHNLALNWNLGEENTQTTEQLRLMIGYLRELDPYDHPIVLHTFPNQQDKQYRPFLGDESGLTGLSLQNSGIKDTHWQTVKWVRASVDSGKPWVVAFDESGSASEGQCPDLGYKGYDGRNKDGKMTYDQHRVRRQTLWGHLMGGGAGVEYYFGYKYVENDLVCEDWRSRDASWEYCKIALDWFGEGGYDLDSMTPSDELVGVDSLDGSAQANSKYCLAEPGNVYFVYLATVAETELDLKSYGGREFRVRAYNPRTGGEATVVTPKLVGGSVAKLSAPDEEDWLLVVERIE